MLDVPYNLVFNSSLFPLVIERSLEKELKTSVGPMCVLSLDVGMLLRPERHIVCSRRFGDVKSATGSLRVVKVGEISASSEAASKLATFF